MAETRAAGIDVGSNSFLLLVLARDAAGERVLLDRGDITRLGEGVGASGELSSAAMDRSFATLADYARQLRELDVHAVRAVGTAALRSARNAGEFVARVRDQLGLDIEVVSGDREAELTYAAVADGARAAGRIDPGCPLLNVDIGGGSTEVVRGVDGEVSFRRSWLVGAVRLHEQVGASGEVYSAEQLSTMHALASEQLAEVPPADGAVCGTGGTITTLAAMLHRLTVYDASVVETTRLNPEQVSWMAQTMAGMPLTERRQLPGLPAARADVIVEGAVLLVELMARLGLIR